MTLLQAMWDALVGTYNPPVMRELPDPSDLSDEGDWNEIVTARAACGLKPWPRKSDDDYCNTVIGVCSKCSTNIYGCQAISMGWKENGDPDIRCGACWDD